MYLFVYSYVYCVYPCFTTFFPSPLIPTIHKTPGPGRSLAAAQKCTDLLLLHGLRVGCVVFLRDPQERRAPEGHTFIGGQHLPGLHHEKWVLFFRKIYTRWCPSSLAKLVNITPRSWVYGRYTVILFMRYSKPTNRTRGCITLQESPIFPSSNSVTDSTFLVDFHGFSIREVQKNHWLSK